MSDPPKIVLSVDPGENSAWCLWLDGEYQECGLVDGKNVKPMYRLISGIDAGLEREDRRLLVIEDQYIKFKKGFKTIVIRRARWQAIAELFDWEVVEMVPNSWQSKAFNGMPKGQTKVNSMLIAKDIIGCDPVTDDLSDAVCIGKVWLDMDKLPAEPKKKPKKKRREVKDV